jgi:hypothetical protein
MMRTFAEGVDQLNREASGLYQVELIRKEDHGPIAYALLAGDEAAKRRVNAILQSQRFIAVMAKEKPAVCLTCPNQVTDPDATLALLVAARGEPTIAVCSALCLKCSSGAGDKVLERAAAGYRNAWPGLRCVDVTHPEGGRA